MLYIYASFFPLCFLISEHLSLLKERNERDFFFQPADIFGKNYSKGSNSSNK